MSERKPPLDPAEFDYRKAEEFRPMYEHYGSCLKLATAMREAGRPINANTLDKWKLKLGIPTFNPDYRYREAQRQSQVEDDSFADRIKAYLKRATGPATVEELANAFVCAPKQIRAALAELDEAATLLEIGEDTVRLERDLPPIEEPLRIDVAKYREVEYPIGLTADNHIGSKYERLDVLEALFDRFAAAGAETVYQAGNILDGEARWNKFDVYVHGVEAQIANVVYKWPRRPGITTQFVTADDHEGWYTQREHIDVGRRLEQDARQAGREDLVYLGHMERDIDLAQEYGSARIRVQHGGGGSAYAMSYVAQKLVESLQGGEKPQAIVLGHFHKFEVSYPRGVYVVQPGCTEDQTPFMRKRRIEAHVGGCILWVKQNELGIFTSFRVEWIPFFDRKFYSYRW